MVRNGRLVLLLSCRQAIREQDHHNRRVESERDHGMFVINVLMDEVNVPTNCPAEYSRLTIRSGLDQNNHG